MVVPNTASENKKKYLSEQEVNFFIQSTHPEYKKILNEQQYKTMTAFIFKMVEAFQRQGKTAQQSLKDAFWWAEQFMFQESAFLGLKKSDPLFVHYGLNSEEMFALVRLAYSITKDKEHGKYFSQRANGYKGGLIKYFIDSTRGAFDDRTEGALVGGDTPVTSGIPNMFVDSKYLRILQAWENGADHYLSDEKRTILLSKIAGDKFEK
ncbi:MAG: hypothetical protein ACK4J0_00865 [Candidatus Anstonellaceae archaeon]